MAKQLNKGKKPSIPKNEELTFTGNVRVISEGGEPCVMTLQEAKKTAEDQGLDVVLITAKSDIPIVRICNYEKLMYEMKKNEKKKPHPKPVKEIELSVNIADHDINTKANQARKFIEAGHKVKVTLTMKGREMTRREENKKSILKFIVMLEDIAVPDGQMRDEGNKTVAYLKRKGG